MWSGALRKKLFFGSISLAVLALATLLIHEHFTTKPTFDRAGVTDQLPPLVTPEPRLINLQRVLWDAAYLSDHGKVVEVWFQQSEKNSDCGKLAKVSTTVRDNVVRVAVFVGDRENGRVETCGPGLSHQVRMWAQLKKPVPGPRLNILEAVPLR